MLENNDICVGPDCDNKSKQKRINIFKLLLFLFVATIVIFLVIVSLGMYREDIEGFLYDFRAKSFEEEVDRRNNALLEAMRNDTYGGKTPEETFDLFLGALANNDYELSAKYYDLSVQNEALENLKTEFQERGDLGLSLAYFSDVRRGEKKCNENGDGCVFEYEFEVERGLDANLGKSLNNIGLKFLSLGYNSTSLNWKLDQPF